MHEDVPTRPANHSPGDPGDPTQSLWLVSYADDDDREMTPPQIYQALRRGEIDMETIVWRDGMPDWLPISDVSALKQAIEGVGKTAVDKKKTVMGGFTAQPAAAFPNPSTPSGTPGLPTPGLPTPGPRPVAHSPVPRSTLIGTGARNAPLARGLSSAVPSPHVGNLDEGDLDDNLLESVRPPPTTTQQLFPKLPSNTKTAPMPEVRLRDDEGAISLNSDVIESLPSSALESVVAELPPARPPSAPHSIFDVGEDTNRDLMPETDAPTAPLRASVGIPHAPRPRPPLRDRSVGPAVTQLDSLAPDDPSFAPPPRRSSAGKIIGILLLVGATAVAMFYLGRQTAESPSDAPIAASSPASATAVAAPVEPTPAATPTAEPEHAATGEAVASAAKPNNAEPSEANEASPAAPKPVQRTAPGPRPAAPPSPAPAPRPAEPKPAEPEPVAAAGPFDTAAASAALSAAAGQASSCRKPDDPSGVANVTVTFANSGRAINAVVSGPPFAGTTTGGCIASKMRAARVPPFAGDRITVKKVVVIQ